MRVTVTADVDFRGPSGQRIATLTGVNADGAGELVLLLAGEESVGVTFDDREQDEQLIIGVTGMRAVLAVMTPDAAFDRMNVDAVGDEEVVMLLGGTPTTFEVREVLDVEAASGITHRWVARESRPPGPGWIQN